MHLLILITLAATAAVADFVLYDQNIPFDQLPNQVDTSNGVRGPQAGYNICNSTTEGPQSMCQTAFINGPDDWCLWAPPQPNSSVGNVEGEMVAWCSKAGHGTRIISPNAVTGMHWIQTSKYIQITGTVAQTLINMADGDGGGEMDPHGADLRGNPMGGLVYSTAFSSTKAIEQTRDWTLFIGANTFCMTVCNPEGSEQDNHAYCNNLYDRLGCSYNAPGSYQADIFEQCKGDLKDPVGIFTGSDGVVSTYQQPPESLGPISTVPYDPKVPSSSECSTFSSAALFASAPPTATTSSSASVSASTSRPGTPSSTPTDSSKNDNAAEKSVVQLGVSIAAALFTLIMVM